MKVWIHLWLWTALAGQCEDSYQVLPFSASVSDGQSRAIVERAAATSDPIVMIGNLRTLNDALCRNAGEVIAFDINSADGPLPAIERPESSVSLGAHYPDSANRIQIDLSLDGKPQHQGSGNPWENRDHGARKAMEIILDCGGIMAGADAEPIAILNGRIVKKGDRVDDFIVNTVDANTVFLDHEGTVVAIPRGRRVVVTILPI